MRAVHDQALQQDAGDLLLHRVRRRAAEQLQHDAGEVVGVAVRVAQLVGDRVQHVVAPSRVQVGHEVEEEMYMCAGLSLVRALLQQPDRVNTDVHNQAVDQRDVVLRRVAALPQHRQQRLQEIRGGPAHQVLVEILLQQATRRLGQRLAEVRHDPRGLRDLREAIHLQIGLQRIRQVRVPRIGRQDQVPHLDARRRNDVAEAQMVVDQELREIVQEHQQRPQRPLVHGSHGVGELPLRQEPVQHREQVDHEHVHEVPAFLPIRVAEDLRHEVPAAHELQPRERKAGGGRGPELMECGREGVQHRQGARVQHWIRLVHVHEQAVEDAVVGSLIEAAGIPVPEGLVLRRGQAHDDAKDTREHLHAPVRWTDTRILVSVRDDGRQQPGVGVDELVDERARALGVQRRDRRARARARRLQARFHDQLSGREQEGAQRGVGGDVSLLVQQLDKLLVQLLAENTVAAQAEPVLKERGHLLSYLDVLRRGQARVRHRRSCRRRVVRGRRRRRR
mmetsp:Transcript_1979/g.8732  ORF Transcript_1979/g.8732 Transcript_1979/m.8732 type:complete len:506 (-) Transcript_1979:5199-6716(-)|eukprot:scaffold7624_cov248-Pinguiococcus_pyrenoidosus.AAC.5